MGKEMISIVVPIYNIKSYLQRCVESIQRQTYKNIEIILVDDGSADGGAEVCDFLSEKDGRIRVLHKENGGLASARNYGLRYASGEYIGFIDGDDYIETKMYEHLMGEMGEDVDAVTCNVREEFAFQYIRKTTNCFQRTEPVKMSQEQAIKELLLLRRIDLSVCNKLFRRKVFEQVTFPEGKSSEDVPVIWEIIKKSHHIVNNGYYDYHYAHRNGSITMGEFSKGRLDGYQFTKRISEDVENNYPEFQEEAAVLNAKFLYADVDQILRSKNSNDYRETFRWLQEELKAYEKIIRKTEYLDENFSRMMIQAMNDSFELQKEQYCRHRETNKIREFYELLLQWNDNQIHGKNIADILTEQGAGNVAIYGMRELGELLYEELVQSQISVTYVIDRRKNEIVMDIPIYEPTEELPPVDAVIVTAITYFDEIRESLNKRIDSKIYDLKELVFNRTYGQE